MQQWDIIVLTMCRKTFVVIQIKFDCIAAKIVVVKFWAKNQNSIPNNVGKLSECGDSTCPLYILEEDAK